MNKFIKILNHAEEIVASSFLIFTSFLVFIQAILRYQFNYSLYWSEEVARILIAWFIFLGSSIAVREKAHVSMDAIPNIVPKAVKYILEIAALIVCMVFCIVIIRAGIDMILGSIRLGTTSTSIKIPLYVPYASVPVGLCLMLIRYIIQIKDKIIEAKKFLSE